MRVVGIDPSMTNTGMAWIVDGRITETLSVKSKSKKGAVEADYLERFMRISDGIYNPLYNLGQPDLIVIEGPSFGSASSRFHQLAGMWWFAYAAATETGAPIVKVTPGGRAKYITGSGRAKKDAVLAAMPKFYGVDLKDDNQADALGLAAMGARHLGMPIEIVEEAAWHREAMKAVKWPA